MALWYSVLVVALWSAYVGTAYALVRQAGPVLEPLVNEVVRAAIFVLPAILLLRASGERRLLTSLRLSTNVGRGFLWGLLAGSALLATHAVVRLVLHGNLDTQPVPTTAFFTALSLATLTEELAFRGYLLQQLSGRMGFWAADTVSAALFAGIHIPGWILVGEATVGSGLLVPLGEIFALGFALGILLRWTGSVWSCCVLHAANNLAYILFYSAG